MDHDCVQLCGVTGVQLWDPGWLAGLHLLSSLRAGNKFGAEGAAALAPQVGKLTRLQRLDLEGE